jgi:serine/threonine protein phosphatase 1
MFYIEGDYLFVHAGLRPGLPLDRQTDEDMMWIRQPFLDSTEDRGNRIGLDTGAVWSGCLTVMEFTDTAHDVLQT